MLFSVRRQGVLWVLLLLVFLSCQQSALRKQNVISQFHLIDNLVAIDSLMEIEIAPYRDSLSNEMSKVIGVAAQELSGGLPEGLLSNFVSDLILEECILNSDRDTKPDISIINIKGLRIPLQKGEITVGNIYQLMPFENEIVYLTLTKDHLLELFNYMASVGGDGISGASFGIRNGVAVNVKVGDKALEDRNYVVVTSDYLADGGDHFDVFKSAIERTGSSLKVRDVIIQHIQSLTANKQIIDSHLDKRIYNEEK